MSLMLIVLSTVLVCSKSALSRPTCTECARIFPSACGVDIANHIKAEKLAKEAEQRRLEQARALEVLGRQYCRSEFLSGIDADFSDSSAFLSGSSDASSSTQSSSGSTRSSSSSTSEDLGFVLSDGSKSDTLRLMRTMEAVGRIQCPPIQCFTENDDVVQQYHAKSETWYQASTDYGSCVINGGDCKDSPANVRVSGDWCGKSLANCRMCWGTWCPPQSRPNHWMPAGQPPYTKDLSSRFHYGVTHKGGNDNEDTDQSASTASNYDRSMCSSASVTRKSQSDKNTLGTSVDFKTDVIQHIADVSINSETYYAGSGQDSLADSIDQVEDAAEVVQEQIKFSTSEIRIETAVQVAFQLVQEDTIVHTWLRTAVSVLSGTQRCRTTSFHIAAKASSVMASAHSHCTRADATMYTSSSQINAES